MPRLPSSTRFPHYPASSALTVKQPVTQSQALRKDSTVGGVSWIPGSEKDKQKGKTDKIATGTLVLTESLWEKKNTKLFAAWMPSSKLRYKLSLPLVSCHFVHVHFCASVCVCMFMCLYMCLYMCTNGCDTTLGIIPQDISCMLWWRWCFETEPLTGLHRASLARLAV